MAETPKATKSAPAVEETTPIGRQPGAPRAARAIISGASTLVAMINRNERWSTSEADRARVHPAMPRRGTIVAQHRHINPERGQDQRNPKQHKYRDRHTTRPLLRQLIAYGDGEDHGQ